MSQQTPFTMLISQLIGRYHQENIFEPDDENDHYVFELENSMPLHILLDQYHNVHLVSFISLQSQILSISKMSELLEFNQFGLYRTFFTIGLDDEHQQLHLHTKLPMAQLNIDTLTELFESSVQKTTTLETWLYNSIPLAKNEESITTLSNKIPGGIYEKYQKRS